MTISVTDILVNNIAFGQTPVEVRLATVTINWLFTTPADTVTQNAIEVRVGSHKINWGSDDYNPDIFRQSLTQTKATSWAIRSKFLTRGNVYYGQLRVRDNLGDSSEWKLFSFEVSAVPYISSISLLPLHPSVNDDLVLSYSDPRGGTSVKVRWLKNGVHQTELDNFTFVSREYLHYGDIWQADVTPLNSLEIGRTTSSSAVTISKQAPIGDNLRVLPIRPTTQDILEASYSVHDPNTGTLLLNDKSEVRWFVNGAEVGAAFGSKTVRFRLQANDEVWFTLTPYDGIFRGSTIISPTVTIADDGFRVVALKIDGLTQNIGVKTINPTIDWDVFEPLGRTSRYAKISIGTAPGASNVYENVIETFEEKFVVPNNVLQRGVDYYITVSASDSPDLFDNFTTSHFRLAGSLWETLVSNATGWTIEFAVAIENATATGYQRLSVGDGACFAELRFYTGRIDLMLGNDNIKTYDVDMTSMRVFVVTGKVNSIKVFLDNEMVLDGSSKFLEPTSERFIEIGAGADSDAIGLFKRLTYTIDGAYDPKVDSAIYSAIKLQPLIEFTESEVASVIEHEGNVVVAVNPFNDDESGKIFKVVETEEPVLASTENLDSFALRINGLAGSPDESITFISHTKGTSYFENFLLSSFDSEVHFGEGIYPERYGWELTRTTRSTAASYTRDGLLIDTTFANIGTSDTNVSLSLSNVQAIRFSPRYSFFLTTYEIEIASRRLNIYLTGEPTPFYSTALDGKNVSTLVEELDDLTGASSNDFALFVRVEILNNVEDQPAASLLNFAKTGFVSFSIPIILSGSYFAAVDPYNPDPYSKVSGGRWFYSHRRPGTPWFDKVDNAIGWSIDFDVTVEAIEDDDRPIDTPDPDGSGLYINDGKFYENIQFLTQEIVLGSSGKSFLVDNTSANRFRIVGKDDNLRIYVRRPSSLGYELLTESKMTASSTRQANGGRPAVCQDDSGNSFAVWHDDGDGGRQQLYYSTQERNGAWSEPELIVSDSFGASHPDIAIDSTGIVYVVFETHQSDFTDIAVIHKGEDGWSEPYLISSELGNSLSPRIAIDRSNSVHVVWEDHRNVNPEIYYCRRRGSDGQWESSAFGKPDTRLSISPFGAVRPAISCLGDIIAVVWASHKQDGSSSIYMAQNFSINNEANSNWVCSGQGGADFLISAIDSNRADFPDIASDTKGRFFVTWHEIVDETFQINARIVGARMTFARDIVTLTQSDVDCRYPKVGVRKTDGFVYIVYERGEFGVIDPYDPYGASDDRHITDESPNIRIVRWNALSQSWESPTQTSTEVRIEPGDLRTSRRPNIAPLITSDSMHILYEARMVSDSGIVQNISDSYSLVRDAAYDFTWTAVYDISALSDPYFDVDANLSGSLLRKEIRFGDFSNTVGIKYLIDKVRYYLNGDFAPFNIRFVSPATVNMPKAVVYSTAGNNRGDAWLGTDQGLIFFNARTNKAFLFDESKFGIAGLKIYSIAFDRNGNMYLATSEGLFFSIDHAYFWKIGGDVPAEPLSVDADSRNRLHVASKTGYFIIDTDDMVSAAKVDKDNAQTARTLTPTTILTFTTISGMPTDYCSVVRVDANDVAWIGTSKGLVRQSRGQISVFTEEHGLSASKITDIAIRDTAVRFIATTSGVDLMTGVTVEKLDFGNLSAPVVGATDAKPDASIPAFNHVRAIHWREPNVLFVGTTHTVYQIEFADRSFQTEKIKFTEFSSKDFSLTDITFDRNDGLQTFQVVGLEDRQISRTVFYEVMLNGKNINRGYRFSPDKQLLRFDYPLQEEDDVKINVRFDIEIVNDFKQNEAQKVALGNKATRIEKLLSRDGGLYAQTGGDINTIQVNDDEEDLPFDRIILDTHPPQGKIRIGEQIDKSVFRVNIEKLFVNNEYLPFDATSGIDKMVISNFTNFTTDGENAQSLVPFLTTSNHDIGTIFDAVTREYAFASGKGRVIKRWIRLDGTQRMMAATAFPSNIYMFNPTTALWELTATLDDGNPLSEVHFIEVYQGILIVGTGIEGGTGRIWISTDGSNFTLLRTLGVAHAYCAEVSGGILYIGAGGNEGRVYAYDGVNVTSLFTNISGAIYDMVAVDNELYAATGSEGRTYRLDPINLTQQILDANADSTVLSVGFAEINTRKYIFTGTGTTAQIRRSTLPDGPFIHSVRMPNAPVYKLNLIGGKLWAAIGNTAFALNNVWTAEYTHTEDIRDISVGIGDVPWFVSENYIYKIGESEQVKRVYLKLIDRAGNETTLFLDTLQTQLDPNLYDSITLEELATFTNQNRLLEVDAFGNTVFTYADNASFYSADKLDEEIGTYYSEIFNGTNNIVSWDRILWDATIPTGTTMRMYVRTATNRDDLLDADFNVVFEGIVREGDISFLTGQFLQFKVVMSSRTRGLSPALRSVIVRSIASQATHFFTTNFVLPSRVKSGILTSTKMIPVAADIVFGIDTKNSTDFGDYQIVDENRIFTTDDQQIGKNLRIGVKLLTPSRGESIAEDFGEYGPYNSMLFFNAVDWAFTNTGGDDTFNFKISFYDIHDVAKITPLLIAFSGDSTSGFSDDGELISSSGSLIYAGTTHLFSFVPVGETILSCNTYYFVKVEAKNSSGDWTTVFDDRTFIEACGTTFVDDINFQFTNESASNNFNYRIRFYKNPERTDLYLTAFSGNDQTGWSYGDAQPFTSSGVFVHRGTTEMISYHPSASLFTAGTTYYLSIDAFNGTEFIQNSNSFTFKTRGVDEQIYCGPYTDVPVVKNLSVMFELEGNQFVTLKVT